MLLINNIYLFKSPTNEEVGGSDFWTMRAIELLEHQKMALENATDWETCSIPVEGEKQELVTPWLVTS